MHISEKSPSPASARPFIAALGRISYPYIILLRFYFRTLLASARAIRRSASSCRKYRLRTMFGGVANFRRFRSIPRSTA
jgi:hypothetical protein